MRLSLAILFMCAPLRLWWHAKRWRCKHALFALRLRCDFRAALVAPVTRTERTGRFRNENRIHRAGPDGTWHGSALAGARTRADGVESDVCRCGNAGAA